MLSAKNLDDRHIQSLADISEGSTPAIRISSWGGRNSALRLTIRGVGAMGDANQPARDMSVGVYLDSIYLGRIQGLGAAL